MSIHFSDTHIPLLHYPLRVRLHLGLLALRFLRVLLHIPVRGLARVLALFNLQPRLRFWVDPPPN